MIWQKCTDSKEIIPEVF